MKRIYDFKVGDCVDDLIITDFAYNKHHQRFAICMCNKCNRVKNVVESCLVNHKGTTHTACGQYLKTKDKKFYQTWVGMKQRIYNENYHHSHRYSGRNLKCDYDIFIDFYDDLYESYLDALQTIGHDISLDRIDNDVGYVKGNLRWTTQLHQVRNSSKVKEFYALSPLNVCYKSNNERQFAIQHNLVDKQISAVLRGRFKTTLGWKFSFEPFGGINTNNIIEEMYY